MCKHKNVKTSMFTTFNHPYFAICMDCGEELILQPPKLRTTATIGKPNRMARITGGKKMTIQQVSIAFAKYITGYRPGDDGWSPEDEKAYKFALCDEAFTEGDKKPTRSDTVNEIRVRIIKEKSLYTNKLGKIVLSCCDGTFKVEVAVEGHPCIYLSPAEIEPC